MKYTELKYLIYSDLYRYYGRFSKALLTRELFWGFGTRFTFWLRLTHYLSLKPKIFYPLFRLSWLILRHYTVKYGIQIGYKTDIGPGFYIGHFGNILVNSKAKIGKNCNISHEVTLGSSPRGSNPGFPIIGDNVYIGPGAKIVGGVKIGNNVAIGANAVVTKDVQDDAVVAGVPAKFISSKGSASYINNIDY